MFTTPASNALSLVVMITFLVGCDYESHPSSEFENNLNLSIPCYPPTEYLPALRQHVKDHVEKIKSDVNQQSTSAKYEALQSLFEFASSDVTSCLFSIPNSVETNSFYDEDSVYIDLWTVVETYKSFDIPWNAQFSKTIERVFEGEDIFEDSSWVPDELGGKPCNDGT